MNRKLNEVIPSTLVGFSGIASLLLSFLVELRYPMEISTAKTLGIIILVLGMAIVVFSAMYIKGAFAGAVKPILSYLVKKGPYRFTRHPVYLGMTIALLGVTVSLRSWMGLIAVLLLFLPSEIYRAKLEEKALALKFGDEWNSYASQTGFILPFLGKKYL